MDAIVDSPPLASRDALSRFLVAMHNSVNARLGRRARDYASVKTEYCDDDGAPPASTLAAWVPAAPPFPPSSAFSVLPWVIALALALALVARACR